MFLDFKADESYTPNKLSIRAGTAVNDLREVRVVELEEPSGCVQVPLGHHPGGGAEEEERGHQEAGTKNIKVFFLQVAVISNHQNGRDCHVRLVRVYGPKADPLDPLKLPCSGLKTQEWRMHSVVR